VPCLTFSDLFGVGVCYVNQFARALNALGKTMKIIFARDPVRNQLITLILFSRIVRFVSFSIW